MKEPACSECGSSDLGIVHLKWITTKFLGFNNAGSFVDGEEVEHQCHDDCSPKFTCLNCGHDMDLDEIPAPLPNPVTPEIEAEIRAEIDRIMR